MPEFLPLLPGLATRPIVRPDVARTIHLVSVAGRRFTPVQQVFMRLAQAYRWESVHEPA
jgi:LysR family hydrogen peroxide-inducible transcriptional activator